MICVKRICIFKSSWYFPYDGVNRWLLLILMLWVDKFLFLRIMEAIDFLMFSLVSQFFESLFKNLILWLLLFCLTLILLAKILPVSSHLDLEGLYEVCLSFSAEVLSKHWVSHFLFFSTLLTFIVLSSFSCRILVAQRSSSASLIIWIMKSTMNKLYHRFFVRS
jgi:hypothetical protein